MVSVCARLLYFRSFSDGDALVGTVSNLQAAKAEMMARVRQPHQQQRPSDRPLFSCFWERSPSSTMPRFWAANGSTNRRSSASLWSLEKVRWFGLGALLLLYYYGGGGIGAALGFSTSSRTRAASSGSSFLQMSFLSSEEDGSLVLSSETSSTAADASSSDNDTSSEDDFQYVFWLMPVEQDAQLLETTLMDGLRQEYDAVSFAPHVTLGPPVSCSQIPDPRAALRTLTSSSGGGGVTTTATRHRSPRLRGSSSTATNIVLHGAHADFGERYTQSVFLRLASNSALDRLYERSREVSGLEDALPDAADHFPHLSVLYENCCPRERQAAAERVQRQFQTTRLAHEGIAFDAVQIIRIQLPVEGPEDVQKWKVVGTEFLR